MSKTEKQVYEDAYRGILKRAVDAFHRLEERAWPALSEEIREAAEFEAEAEELARDEMRLLGQYVRRDLHRLWHYVAETGEGLAEWLRFDRELLEERVAEALSRVADPTQVEGQKLQRRLQEDDSEEQYTAGEIACGGCFRCEQCGEEFQLLRVSRIESCRHCGNACFERISAVPGPSNARPPGTDGAAS